MTKIKAIIKREYLTRVKKKSFILTTLLIPVGLLLLIVVPVLMMSISTGATSVAILSHSDLFDHNIDGNSTTLVTWVSGDIEEWKETYSDGFDALLYIPSFDLQYPGGVRIYSEKQIGLSKINFLENQIEKVIETARFEQAEIDKELVEKLRVRLKIESIVISKEGEKSGNMIASMIMGQVMAFFMYWMIFFYGMMIMRGICDEKKNRIVEILVSSIKPFDIMCGKIIGIAAVALTQLLIWAIMSVIIFSIFTVAILPILIGSDVNIETAEMSSAMNNNLVLQIVDFIDDPGAINIPMILCAFSFYFLFGYLFYSTMFAAIGSVLDNESQEQTFTLPVTIPIILSLYIMLNVPENPHSGLAVWSSIIPFSSPIVMLARLPFNVPLWQLLVSIVTMIISFFASTWAAGKIYRTGILMYGKKLNWKDLWRFISK